jgi:hypothetical protein
MYSHKSNNNFRKSNIISEKFRVGASNGIVLTDYKVKNEIVDYLFNNVDLSKYRYNMLSNLQKLEFLKSSPHYVAPNYKGINYLMIFKSINNNKYCVLIPKKNLSYHRNQCNVKNLFVIRLKVDVADSMFNGTIFDGKVISTKDETDENNIINLFLIKDCYYLMGNNLEGMEMKQKMMHLNTIIKNNFNGKNSCNNFEFKLNNLLEYSSLEQIIDNIKNKKTKIKTVGLEFFPKYSGITIVYLSEKNSDKNMTIVNNDNTNNINTVESFTYNLIHNLTTVLDNRVYSYENSKKIRKLYLEKTEISDVYEVMDEDEKIGIAHIPNYKISKMCRENIKTKSLVKCCYNDKFKKWIPLEILQ